MRILLVVEDTPFFLPAFLGDFLSGTPDEVVDVALVTKIKAKNGIFHYARRHLWYFTPTECVKLAFTSLRLRTLAVVSRPRREGPHYSVRTTLKAFGIKPFKVKYDINRPEHLARIAAAKPDVIINFSPLIFGERLLSIPSTCCLNRHSALLPAYGGHWPVFQAYRAGESFTGVTAHIMERSIDSGPVLAQRKIPIGPGDSVSTLYQRCFDTSADVMFEALDRIRAADLSPQNGAGSPSYFSFPTHEEWKQFRARGGRIC